MGRSFTQIRRARPEEVVELRHLVLRPTSPRAEAVYDGDFDPRTHHFVAVDQSGGVVGCATYFAEPWKLTGEPGWRLRGMAVRPDRQRSGVGGQILATAEQGFIEESAADPASPLVLWCQGRTGAIGFYEGNGWQVIGEEFEVEPSGPHYLMVKRLIARPDPRRE